MECCLYDTAFLPLWRAWWELSSKRCYQS